MFSQRGHSRLSSQVSPGPCCCLMGMLPQTPPPTLRDSLGRHLLSHKLSSDLSSQGTQEWFPAGSLKFQPCPPTRLPLRDAAFREKSPGPAAQSRPCRFTLPQRPSSRPTSLIDLLCDLRVFFLEQEMLLSGKDTPSSRSPQKLVRRHPRVKQAECGA